MNLKNKIVIFLGFLVLFGISLNKIINFQDYNPTVIIQANKFNNKKDKELFEEDNINAEFKSNNNNLGIISVLFTTHSPINDDYLQFKIKESGNSDWYYSNKYKVDQFQDYQYFPFGFPEIKDSKNKKYQIEIESLNGIVGNSVEVVNNAPFLSKYSFPKTYLLQNKNQIPSFVFNKTISFLNYIDLNVCLFVLLVSLLSIYFLRKINVNNLFKHFNKKNKISIECNKSLPNKTVDNISFNRTLSY